jgi:signal transduction histidine kinase
LSDKENLDKYIYHSSEALFLIAEGIVLDCNAGLCELTGYEKHEIKFMPLHSFIREKSLLCDIFSKLENDFEKSEFVSVQRNDGIVFKARLIINKFSFNKTEIITGRLIDISGLSQSSLEKELLIKKLEETNRELIKLSYMKDEFLAVASHDLRAPFNNIFGIADYLLKSHSPSSQIYKYMKSVKDSAELQLNYINDILDIIKIESGQIMLKRESVSINQLIESVIINHEIAANKKNIKIHKHILASGSFLMDFPKISQVLNNLLNNSLKFTKPGGEIDIWCYKNNEENLEVHVKDTGIGIPSENIDRLFSRYKQIRELGTGGEKGTGLGLAICKNLVELHGGVIKVNSKKNIGSDFYFILPV